MAVTDKERFACLPEAAKVGDVVCVVYGRKVPYVLRPVSGGFRILGKCYVDGMMDGETLKVKGPKDQDLILKQCPMLIEIA